MEIRQWDGKPISVPGIYAGVPLATYHSAGICDGQSISSSGLRTIFAKSAAHYWAGSPYNDEREDEDEEESQAFVVGRAAHHLFLGQQEFAKEFAVRPESIAGAAWQGNRTVCREWLASKRAKGLTILTPDQARRLIRMVKVLEAEPIIKSGIIAGKIEHSMFWRAKSGTWLKSRPDAIPTDALDFSDFKSTHSVDALKIVRSIDDFGYHMQGALVGMGVRALLGAEMSSFNLIFQEKKAPYSVRVVAMKADDLRRGERECELALAVFDKCMATGEWPGPAGRQAEVHYLGLSEYAARDRDYRAKMIEAELAAGKGAKTK